MKRYNGTLSSSLSCYNKPVYEVNHFKQSRHHSRQENRSLDNESKISTSEINRILNRNTPNSNKYLILDQYHLMKLKDPKNAHIAKYFLPEDYGDNARKIHSSISARSHRQHNRNHPLDDPSRTSMAQLIQHKAKTYKFKLKDLNKYSKTLSYKDINWKV